MSSSITKHVCRMAALLGCFLMVSNQSYANSDSQAVTDTRQAELTHIVKQDCGSCHGMTLNRGLGPALLVENLENKPILFLQNTILYGLPGTAMPPWKKLLTEQEALWIAEQLKQGKITNNNTNKRNN